MHLVFMGRDLFNPRAWLRRWRSAQWTKRRRYDRWARHIPTLQGPRVVLGPWWRRVVFVPHESARIWAAAHREWRSEVPGFTAGHQFHSGNRVRRKRLSRIMDVFSAEPWAGPLSPADANELWWLVQAQTTPPRTTFVDDAVWHRIGQKVERMGGKP